jgi:hypothetical protein
MVVCDVEFRHQREFIGAMEGRKARAIGGTSVRV